MDHRNQDHREYRREGNGGYKYDRSRGYRGDDDRHRHAHPNNRYRYDRPRRYGSWPYYYTPYSYYPYNSHLGFYINPYGYFGGYLGYRYVHGYGHAHGPHVTYWVGRSSQDEDMGGLDFDVRPEKAEVYIDGQYVGVADQFDGFPSYLWLEKGTYDVVIYRDGYETIARQITIYPGVVIDIEDQMKPGQAVRPEDLVSKSTERRDERLRRDRERAEAAEQAERRRDGLQGERIGRLQLSIWPEDAAVYLDGHFLGIAGEVSQLTSGLLVEPGKHLVEVAHPSFDTQSREIEVDSGEKLSLELDLTSP